MASKLEHNDEDSFIILGTSPGTSLDVKCTEASDAALDKYNLEDALKDLSDEAHMAYKAHFKLDSPSPASMMAASTIVTEDSSTEELQKRFGELLDENVLLKETLKKNNDSMKEQFLLIASCQEDMMKTQMLHKEKFEETKDLVERLRLENKKLKQDLQKKIELEVQTSDAPNAPDAPDSKSGPSSGLEFVTSPDDDIVNKLTAQLELIERQRRQVLVENEKLTWQKESLEHIVDATSKERDDLKEKLHTLELQLSHKEGEYAVQISNLQATVRSLNSKLHATTTQSLTSSDELTKRDGVIEQLTSKVSSLQAELKNAQLKILELENVKLEFTKHRSGLSETVRIYKEQIQDLHNRLKEAQTTVFQPVRLSLSAERECTAGDSSWTRMQSTVRLYDRTLKHLADLLNALVHGLSDSLVQTLGVVSSLHDFKLEKATVEQFKSGLADLKQQLEKQHSSSLNYVVEVRNTLTIFEGIFKEYNELLKKSVTAQECKPASPSPNVEALTSALLARGQELQALERELKTLREARDDTEVLKAQLDLYKSDFEAERGAREQMACDKENILTDLRAAQRRVQELLEQLNEVRTLDPNVYWTATTKRTPQPTPATPSAPPQGSAPGRTNGTGASRGTAATGARKTSTGTAGFKHTTKSGTTSTGDKKPIYTCPKCMRFKSDNYNVIEDHLDFCLDDDPCSPV